MKHPSQEDLLGYVLGALDAQEQRSLQQLIDDNPEIEEQLLQIKTGLLPLDCLEATGPRPGLARRTCESVAGWQKSPQHLPASPGEHSADDPLDGALDSQRNRAVELALAESDPIPSERCNQPARMGALRDRFLHPSSWSIPDVLVGMALIAIMAGILFPAISYSRYQSRVFACQDNLRQVGVAMKDFSTIHDGSFVTIPREGNLAASGCFGPILKDAGLLQDDSLLACAGIAANSPPVHIPSCNQVNAATCDEELNHYRQTMAGHYGYTMGYWDKGRYSTPRDMGRTNVVLVSDRPSLDLPGRRSANHNGKGQNCLFEDGRVVFVAGHTYGSDALFENDYGVVGPGSNASDNVIAPSHLSPGQAEQMDVYRIGTGSSRSF